MTKRLSKKSKWYLPYETRATVIHYARQYREWKNEYNTIGGTGSYNMDGMPHGQNDTDTTQRDGMRRAELSSKIQLIEDTVREVDEDIYKWLLIGVTQKVSYDYLRNSLDIPCGERQYHEKKREFHYRLSKKI